MYGDYGLSRKDAEKIFSKFTCSLFVPTINIIEKFVEPLLEGNEKIKILTKLQETRQLFSKYGSFHLYLKYIENEGFYRAPKNIEINNVIGPVVKDNKPTLDEIKAYQSLMPLEHQFQKFFELPGI